MMRAPSVPRVDALQRLWLREIGIEKTWGIAAQPVTPEKPGAAPGVESSAAAPVSAGPAAASKPMSQSVPQSAPQSRLQSRPQSRLQSRPKAAASALPDISPERAARIAGAAWEDLQTMVSGCRDCGLCEGRHHAVFGMGAQPPRWLVVGEAPGADEDRQGLPFVGRSGQLLDAMLAAVGFSRERDVYIANVIKCRPEGNRNPTPVEVAACSPYLLRQIALLKPERILALGRYAAQTLLNTEGSIGSLRGRTHALSVDGLSIPVVVSYHPSYLLRTPTEKAKAWEDLQQMLKP